MTQRRLGYVVATIGLVMFLAGWNVHSTGSSGRGMDHTPEATYGGVVVFLAGVWILVKTAD